MTIKDALKEVLRNALIHDGLARGLREAVKALDKYVLLLYRSSNNIGYLDEPRPHSLPHVTRSYHALIMYYT